MGVFRVALLLANVALFLQLLYLITKDHGGAAWFGYAVLTGLTANCAYLLLSPTRSVQWRVFRVFSLWFDTKEAELRARAHRARENSN